MKCALLLTAAGSSVRFGEKKEFIPLSEHSENDTVLSRAASVFLQTDLCSVILITAAPGKEPETREALGDAAEAAKKRAIPIFFAEGGKTRQESVRNGLLRLDELRADIEFEAVLIHDGARPWVSENIIKNVARGIELYGAAAPAIQAVDTQKEADGTGRIIRHLQRKQVFAVQTPQGFLFEPLLEAHKKAAADGGEYTDDTEIWGRYCGDVYLTAGDIANKKITFSDDIPRTGPAAKPSGCKTRIGLGYDLHRLVEKRPLMIGGVRIPYQKGEDGHSDGDVLLHAITDALLGAAALADIGELFPPSDPTWKNADSAELLAAAWEKARAGGWRVENLDCVIALEQPKMLPYRQKVRERIAAILQIETDRVFVKAKTGEQLGDIGNGNAVAAWAVCLLSGEKQ